MKKASLEGVPMLQDQKGKKNRESNRLKYRSGSGSRNLIFNGSVPVQVQDFLKIWVQVRFGFSYTKI